MYDEDKIPWIESAPTASNPVTQLHKKDLKQLHGNGMMLVMIIKMTAIALLTKRAAKLFSRYQITFTVIYSGHNTSTAHVIVSFLSIQMQQIVPVLLASTEGVLTYLLV